ncbi:MarR family transcriptional regulator [Desulfosporosinus sp. PR]|uniref:MarR family winged helix-turn-helix transcriptional regulator n=1 Tax=Candidatus Desulfosporosinus nitrosoreducens TaxID=3401928 RepID=UPI0027ECD20C|nr:MarR family transcriptional regulator [Desulfosporosinus sp. PR]MDQ7096627.1 MarR family transcriptional regulator [Desulfosporosinus sp. PR]
MAEYSNEQKQKDLVISFDELLFTLSQFIRLYQKGMYRARLPYVPYRGQNRVLNIIADNDGLNQKELAELLDIRSASMSELLNKLERSSLITREKDEADKRITHVFLSDEGRKLANSSQSQGDFAEMLFGSLPDEEKHMFYTIMKKLCAVFEAQALLEGEDSEESLPPHLRDGHMPPHPPETRPLPPHLRKGSASGPPEKGPLQPYWKK